MKVYGIVDFTRALILQNVNYVDQTSWGNGAGQSYLLKIMSRHYQVVDITTTTTTASCDKIELH